MSLVNTIAKFSDAIINYKQLAGQALDMQKKKVKEDEKERLKAQQSKVNTHVEILVKNT